MGVRESENRGGKARLAQYLVVVRGKGKCKPVMSTNWGGGGMSVCMLML